MEEFRYCQLFIPSGLDHDFLTRFAVRDALQT